MIYNAIIVLLNILIIESAVFTLCFINNSRRLLSFITFLLSAFTLLVIWDMEFFAILLLILYTPVVFVYFMLSNMIRIKKECHINPKTAWISGLISGVFTSVLCFRYPPEFEKQNQVTLILNFISDLYGKYVEITAILGVIAFISVIAVVVLFIDNKKMRSK